MRSALLSPRRWWRWGGHWWDYLLFVLYIVHVLNITCNNPRLSRVFISEYHTIFTYLTTLPTTTIVMVENPLLGVLLVLITLQCPTIKFQFYTIKSISSSGLDLGGGGEVGGTGTVTVK